MRQCVRCGRYHSGLCGIPAGVTKGFGAKVGGLGAVKVGAAQRNIISGKPMNLTLLEKLLSEGLGWEKRIIELLRSLSQEQPEYEELLVRLDKVQAQVKVTREQISRILLKGKDRP